jgi:hypothetical protein
MYPMRVHNALQTGSSSIHRELEKVKFPEFMGATEGSAVKEWLENMVMCFTLCDYTSNMKVRIDVFQLKGSALLWWKKVLPQLNMVVKDVSCELFEEQFHERYLSEEFIEHQLNEFNAFQQGGHTVPKYDSCEGEDPNALDLARCSSEGPHSEGRDEKRGSGNDSLKTDWKDNIRSVVASDTSQTY